MKQVTNYNISNKTHKLQMTRDGALQVTIIRTRELQGEHYRFYVKQCNVARNIMLRAYCYKLNSSFKKKKDIFWLKIEL